MKYDASALKRDGPTSPWPLDRRKNQLRGHFPPTRDQVPRLYFTARGVSTTDGKARTGTEDDEDIIGVGVLVEQGGGVAGSGTEGGKGGPHAGRPILMSRAMRDFAGLDQVPDAPCSYVRRKATDWRIFLMFFLHARHRSDIYGSVFIRQCRSIRSRRLPKTRCP